MQGFVVWFSKEKGFGFLRADGAQEDIFCHFSSIQMKGYKQLEKDQRVQFEIIDGPKGKPQADAVTVIS